MGCANSMPLMNGSGGMVEAAKSAVNDTMHAGEEVLQDVGDGLNGAAVSVKEAVIGAVKNIGNGVDDFTSDMEHKIEEKFNMGKKEEVVPTDENGEPLCRTIPLKDSKTASFDEMDEFKDMLSKMTDEQSHNIETKMNAVVEDIDDAKNKVVNSVHEFTEIEMNDKTPTHSLDSLKTSTPEPEIINAMLNDSSKSAPSPKPTLKEMRSIEEMDEVLDIVRMGDVLENNKISV